MNWSDVGKTLRSIAGDSLPAIGTALGGPAGAAVGFALSRALGTDSTPEAVAAALNPQSLVQLKQIDADLQKTQIQADSANLQAVNKTMQSEAASDHWPTYSWRPAIGFAVAINTLATSIIVLSIFIAQISGMNVSVAMAALPTVIGSLAAANATTLPVLGVASYWRGKMQADPRVKSDNRG